MLYQYLYISTAPDLSREEVEQILVTSARNNPVAGITGILVYNGRNFLQLLEGETAALNTLMRKIGHDPRHTGITMLHSNEIAERACPDWAMKWIPIDEGLEQRRVSLANELPSGIDGIVRQMILNFATLN